MTRFAGIQAALKPNAKLSLTEDSHELPGDQTDPEETETQPDSIEKEKEMTEETEKVRAEAHADGFKAANDRMNAVFASEHYTGREALAQKLLAKNMSADDIIDVLAATPAANIAAPAPSSDASEAGGIKVMQEALKSNTNAALVVTEGGQDNDGEPSQQAIANGWKGAVERANQLAGF